MTILHEILTHKERELEVLRSARSAEAMAEAARAVGEAPRGFRNALATGQWPCVIAEVKRRSPSKGEIRPDFDPVACAVAYEAGGAAALSVLTDSHYFGGELSFLRDIRERVALPLLRKDFVIDAYQIDEARVAGADAVLLIASALEPARLAALHKHALGLGLDVLVEVHDEHELESALHAEADLIGVNNRNLHTFECDLGVTEALAARLGARLRGTGDVLLVAESGIFDNEDLERLGRAGARAFLVGESLMRQEDLSRALRRLRRGQ